MRKMYYVGIFLCLFAFSAVGASALSLNTYEATYGVTGINATACFDALPDWNEIHWQAYSGDTLVYGDYVTCEDTLTTAYLLGAEYPPYPVLWTENTPIPDKLYVWEISNTEVCGTIEDCRAIAFDEKIVTINSGAVAGDPDINSWGASIVNGSKDTIFAIISENKITILLIWLVIMVVFLITHILQRIYLQKFLDSLK